MIAVDWQIILILAILIVAAANVILLLRGNRQLNARLDRVERNLSVTMRKRADIQTSRIKALILKDARITARKEYQLSEAYLSLVNVVRPREPLPATRAWAASPDLLKHLYTTIRCRKPAVVMELGGGISTLIIAYALSKNGSGKLVSVDHSKHYSTVTKEQLQLHDLERWVEQLVAPLTPLSESGDVKWYSTDALVAVSEVDMLLVDGPPADTGERARLPAVPVLKSKLTKSAVVMLDDGIRDEEKEIALEWAEELGCSADYLPFEKGLFVFDRAESSR